MTKFLLFLVCFLPLLRAQEMPDLDYPEDAFRSLEWIENNTEWDIFWEDEYLVATRDSDSEDSNTPETHG